MLLNQEMAVLEVEVSEIQSWRLLMEWMCISCFTDGLLDCLQIVEAEVDLVATEAAASEVAEVSVGETAAALVEVVMDSEGATRWEEGELVDHSFCGLTVWPEEGAVCLKWSL